jgi:hypothetical protein
MLHQSNSYAIFLNVSMVLEIRIENEICKFTIDLESNDNRPENL